MMKKDPSPTCVFPVSFWVNPADLCLARGGFLLCHTPALLLQTPEHPPILLSSLVPTYFVLTAIQMLTAAVHVRQKSSLIQIYDYCMSIV